MNSNSSDFDVLNTVQNNLVLIKKLEPGNPERVKLIKKNNTLLGKEELNKYF